MTTRTWFPALLLLVACRPDAPKAPTGASSGAQTPATPSVARSTPPALDGPVHRTVLSEGCSIAQPRAVVCSFDNHTWAGDIRWQPLTDAFEPGEHYVHIAAQGERMCGLIHPSGRVACWTTLRPDRPRESKFFPLPQLEPIANAVDFAILKEAMCALDDTGTVSCWGGNSAGQLGDGTRVSRGEPRPVELPAPATDIEGRRGSMCALLKTGDVLCWGGNEVQGDPRRLRPEPIRGLPPVRALETTNRARLADGSWATWGTLNHVPERGFTSAEHVESVEDRFRRGDCWLDAGQLWCKREDDTSPTPYLDQVVELEDRGDTCMRRADQSVWCLGSGLPFHDPAPQVEALEPSRVPGLADVSQVAANGSGACALHGRGIVSCWGLGDHLPHHELQHPGFIGTPTDVPLPGPADLLLVASNGACARVEGNAYCWGSKGQVRDLGPTTGLGTRAGLPCAEAGSELRCLDTSNVAGEHPRLVPPADPAAASAWGRRCVVRNGRVQCKEQSEGLACPYDNQAEDACEVVLNRDPDPLSFDRPLRVGRGDRLFVGGGGNCVLRTSGKLSCNASLRTNPSFEGFDITGQRDIISVDAGFISVCGIERGGALRCWARDRYDNRPGRPLELDIEDAVAVSLGFEGGYVIREDGSLWAWGPNHQGQRGLGGSDWEKTLLPVRMKALGPDAVMPKLPEYGR